MPVYIALQAIFEGIDSIPYIWPIIKTIPWIVLLWILKVFFSGASNLAERKMHGKVVLVTGGTSGIGEATVRALAARGAQIVLLTQHSLSDPFIVEHIEDIRKETNNELITAEQVDLSSLHSIRKFATKWIDNAPPRRLDMIVLCGNTMTPKSRAVQSTREGVELNWQVNYLANFHLLSILSPALRAQPPDRDVRIVFATCSSYLGGNLEAITNPAETAAKHKKVSKREKAADTTAPPKAAKTPIVDAYATSKLALTIFALAFQKHLSAYKRPDDMPMNSKVILVDPGFCRTPGTRRWLASGTLLGLLLYLLSYPFWWLVLKSPLMGAQSFLHAAMEEGLTRSEGGILLKECKQRNFLRAEVEDEVVQKQLWQYSERMVEEAEKRGALERARLKKEEEERKEEADAAKELKDYKEKVGKKDGQQKGAGTKSKKGK
ncbi:NAD(P)-binding protein [Dissoconium aciculare CBS 342.82]|uniref:NAD(P)-binding protein n=1 Tax=Dissoconium aciculare CBS 342.82 TaxID=1314786 RepID=A0A6J3M0Z5_9PEZI|nr:NAD(P)-binding protein [Dissoconium aciculare CBS 342.82]KAF1821710.1 NAD(P)-binding protein [Dissoconium aciculare CBS 342.82]